MHQALGVAPLKSRLEAIGGWPLIDSGAWKDEEFTWYNICMWAIGLLSFTILEGSGIGHTMYTMGHQIIRYLIELLNYHLRIW